MIKAVPDKSAKSVRDFLMDWTALFGPPVLWSSDWENVFVSEMLRTLRRYLSIGEYMGSTFSPATQGQVEQLMGRIKIAIAAKPTSTPTDVMRAVMFTNNITPRTNGMCPAEVFLGFRPRDAAIGIDNEVPSLTICEAITDVRESWQHYINAERSRIADSKLGRGRNSNFLLTPGMTVLRVIVDPTTGRSKREGKYTVVSQDGDGERYLIRSADREYYCPGHQLVYFDSDLAKSLRTGLSSEQDSAEG